MPSPPREVGPVASAGIEEWRDVTGSASDAGGARRFVSGVLQREGVASELADDAVLATSELATNALRHAGGLVALRVDVTGLRVHVEVEDG
ncbi:MAG: ATP-binding protein, partial [Acidimicrobiia bacterium]